MQQAYGTAVPGLMQQATARPAPRPFTDPRTSLPAPIGSREEARMRVAMKQMGRLGISPQSMFPQYGFGQAGGGMGMMAQGAGGAQGAFPMGPQIGMPDIPDAQFPEMDLAPIEQQARTQFAQQTVPSLAERFTSMGAGAQSSAAFARKLGQAGAGLEQSLAAMRARLMPQYAMQRAQYGLQRAGLGMQGAGLGLRAAELGLRRELGMGELGIKQQQLGMQAQQQQAQQMGERTKALQALLGFRPPQMQGAPIVRQSAWQ